MVDRQRSSGLRLKLILERSASGGRDKDKNVLFKLTRVSTKVDLNLRGGLLLALCCALANAISPSRKTKIRPFAIPAHMNNWTGTSLNAFLHSLTACCTIEWIKVQNVTVTAAPVLFNSWRF